MKMKNFIFLSLACLILASCSSDPKEQLISDKVQKMGSTKMDLNFKLLDIEKIADYP